MHSVKAKGNTLGESNSAIFCFVSFFKWMSTLIGKNLLLWKQILFFKSRPFFVSEGRVGVGQVFLSREANKYSCSGKQINIHKSFLS